MISFRTTNIGLIMDIIFGHYQLTNEKLLLSVSV